MRARELYKQRTYFVKYNLPTATGWTAVVIAPSIALAIWTLEKSRDGANVTVCKEIESDFIFAFSK